MKPFPDHVWGQNLRPVSNPDVARAVEQFIDDLVAGRAVKRDDPSAPPLAIEREREKE